MRRNGFLLLSALLFCACPIYADRDGDGWAEQEGDCDDTDPAIGPESEEICDGVDNDCDGTSDDGVESKFYRDADGDGYGSASSGVSGCTAPVGHVTSSDDCDDEDADVHPLQRGWFLLPSVNDSWDYDCDGSAEKKYTSIFLCINDRSSSGWMDSVPECGVEDLYKGGDEDSCSQLAITQSQECH